MQRNGIARFSSRGGRRPNFPISSLNRASGSEHRLFRYLFVNIARAAYIACPYCTQEIKIAMYYSDRNRLAYRPCPEHPWMHPANVSVTFRYVRAAIVIYGPCNANRKFTSEPRLYDGIVCLRAQIYFEIFTAKFAWQVSPYVCQPSLIWRQFYPFSHFM